MDRTSLKKLISLLFTTRRVIKENIQKDSCADPYAWLRIETLRYIEEKGSPTMNELAQYLHITAPSATSLVNTLVRAKQVIRKASTTDKRVVRMELTTEGKSLLRAATLKSEKNFKEVFSHLSEKEIVSFMHVLEKLKEVYTKKKE